MRLFMKRILLLVCGGILITVFLLALPAPHQRHSSKLNLPDNFNKNLPHPHNNYNDDQAAEEPKLVGKAPSLTARKLNKISSSKEYPVPWDAAHNYLPPKQEDKGPGDPSTKSVSDIVDYRTAMRDDNLVAMAKHLTTFAEDTRPAECPFNETLEVFWKRRFKMSWPKDDDWDRFFSQLSSCDLYRHANDPAMLKLLRDLASMPIKETAVMSGGTQVKLVITYENGKKAVFKPMRFGRDYETDPNHFYFTDFERHNAEIAAFHLDRVLNFRRAIPTVGRVFDLREIEQKADKKLAKTFFFSPSKNMCFVGRCDYYCDTTHAICGKPHLKEGSLQAYLPDEEDVPRDHKRSPYRRTYSKKHQAAEWQEDDTYCDMKVKRNESFAKGRRILDLIDLHILDFIMGNQDRHHLQSITVFDDRPEIYPLHIDNGRGFGRTDFDDLDILKPLSQCCLIRPSTLKTLLGYYSGPISLSKAMQLSMFDDPTFPVLASKHYTAVERRLETILRVVHKCLSHKEARDVLVTTFNSPIVVPDPPSSDSDDDEPEPADTHAAPPPVKLNTIKHRAYIQPGQKLKTGQK